MQKASEQRHATDCVVIGKKEGGRRCRDGCGRSVVTCLHYLSAMKGLFVRCEKAQSVQCGCNVLYRSMVDDEHLGLSRNACPSVWDRIDIVVAAQRHGKCKA